MAQLTECEQAAEWLAAAKAAFQELQIGGRAQRVTHADKDLLFTPADVDRLRAHIRNLQDQVDACNGVRRCGKAIHVVPSGW